MLSKIILDANCFFWKDSAMSDTEILIVKYRRVSTARQGRSGLGLSAQDSAIRQWEQGGNYRTVGEFLEIESGKNCSRPQLQRALRACLRNKATLVIGKLDRLARNVHFISGLMEGKVKFVAVDYPNATPLMLHIYAAVAEDEARVISKRTKDALAAAKSRGVALGKNSAKLARQSRMRALIRAQKLRPILAELRQDGITTARAIADALNDREVETPRGGRWHQSSVSNVLKRLAA